MDNVIRLNHLYVSESTDQYTKRSSQLETEASMQEHNLPARLFKRLQELEGREPSYWEDELYSPEALTNLDYRECLERCFKLDPLGPLPARTEDISL